VFTPASPGPAGQCVAGALDALFGIAGRLAGAITAPDELEAEVRRLWELNRSALGGDPDRLRPGTEIILPEVA
jgi:hypothetical protein